MKKMLNVRAVGDALVQDYQAMQSGMRRYIGRKYDSSVGDNGGWIMLDEELQIPDCAEYRHEIKQGNLQAADEYTAHICGLEFIKYYTV